MSCGKKFLRFLSFVGPSIFAIGYTIGTGSVTSMAKAGADYGLGLLWALALSCLFSGAIKEVFKCGGGQTLVCGGGQTLVTRVRQASLAGLLAERS